MSKVLAQRSSEWSEERAISNDANILRSLVAKALEHTTEPVSLGWKNALYDVAMEIGSESEHPDWDGYGGESISRESVVGTMHLIHQLPDSVQQPFLVPSPGGYISFEWHQEGKVLSVSPKKDIIVWASVLGEDDTRYGRSPARKGWPQAVLDILRDYFSRG